ncbi:apolipoprotein F [Ctenodactylus gundi]
MTGLCGHSAPDMRSLRLIMPIGFLLCCVLLRPVDPISFRKQADASTRLLSSLGSQPSSSYPLSCQTLLPKRLPGFTYMAPLAKFLVGLALRNALEEAGCQADARALQLQLYRWGGMNAAQTLIRHLQGLRKGRSTESSPSVEALVSALQLLPRERSDPKRARRSLAPEYCGNEQEQNVYNVVRLFPGVGTYYNLGTALYYAIQNCSDKAKERGQDGFIDLGYDLLMAMTGLSGGYMGLVIGTSLKPALKVGVNQLIQYYKEKEAVTLQPETSKKNIWEPSNDAKLKPESLERAGTEPLVRYGPRQG